MLKKSKPSYVNGTYHALTKGYNINLNGSPKSGIQRSNVTRYAVQPTDYRGIAPIPKVVVEVGEKVLAGQELFYDKSNPEIKYVAPVSGTLSEIRRGQKRSISNLIIDADSKIEFKKFDVPQISSNNRSEIIELMKNSGLWPLINQRPYDRIANPDITPKNIFVSSFNTGPLALDGNLVVKSEEESFQKGLDVLNSLTDGKLYLGLNANEKDAPSKAYSSAKGVEKHWFSGPHPCGNVGIQMHHIDPIGTKDTVWTLDVQSVIFIGRLFLFGHYNTDKLVTIVGTELKNPCYVRTYNGASLRQLLADNIISGDVRVIKGDVLSGEIAEGDCFMSHRNNQVSVVKEGKYFELFGWMVPSKRRPTISKTFLSKLLGFGSKKSFDADTNMHGEPRAFVMTGEYEKVMPMDIYPVHLFKSIIANDLELMEGLGIHELSEEDVALCEFVCTSKQPLQKILREGLDYTFEQS